MDDQQPIETRNVGVLSDSTCILNDHVSKICKSSNYNFYSIRKIRKILWYPNCWENEKLFSNITPGLLQQSSLWCKELQYIPATALPEQCPPDVVANSFISLQFWETYTSCLLSKESNIRCCCSLLKLSIVNPLHISPCCCLCILQPGLFDQRPKIFSEYQDALRMPLHPFGTLSLHLLNVPLQLILSRAAWRLTHLMWHIPRSTDSYIAWVYCL